VRGAGATLLFRPNNLAVRNFADDAPNKVLEKRLQAALKMEEVYKTKYIEQRAKQLKKDEERKLAEHKRKEAQNLKKKLKEVEIQEKKKLALENPQNFVKAYKSLKPRSTNVYRNFFMKNFAVVYITRIHIYTYTAKTYFLVQEYHKRNNERASVTLVALAEAYKKLSPEEAATYAVDNE
jgi:hypothetical protein